MRNSDRCLLVAIIDGEALPELSSCSAHDVVHVGVVVWWPAEDLDADCALFYLFGGAVKGFFNDVTEE